MIAVLGFAVLGMLCCFVLLTAVFLVDEGTLAGAASIAALMTGLVAIGLAAVLFSTLSVATAISMAS